MAMPEGLLIAGFPRIVSLPLEGKAKWCGAKRRIYICSEAATTTLNPST